MLTVFCLPLLLSVDTFSLNGLEGSSIAGVSSLKDSNHGDAYNIESHLTHLGDEKLSQKHGEQSNRTLNVEKHVGTSAITSEEEGLLGNCGILPGNCLPCLTSTASNVDKRNSLSSSPTHSRKKDSSRLSFKWRFSEGNPTTPCEHHYAPFSSSVQQ